MQLSLDHRSASRLGRLRAGLRLLVGLLFIGGFALPAYAQFEVDVPKSVLALNCMGSSGISVGTSGICDIAHLVSEDIHASEPIAGISISGDGEFTIGSGSTCKTAAPPSPGCSVEILFTPTSVGVKAATLVLKSKTSTITMPINGQALPAVLSCKESETPTCTRSDGTPVANSFCGGTPAPVSQSCTSGNCGPACTTGLGAGRFIEIGRICSGKGGCVTFYPEYGITDRLGNSCGMCTTRAANKTPCPSVTAATSCGSSYTVTKRECTFYNVNNTTSTTTFNSVETIASNCIYTLADSSGTTCSSCEATWITPSGGGASPIGTPTGNNTCPFTPY